MFYNSVCVCMRAPMTNAHARIHRKGLWVYVLISGELKFNKNNRNTSGLMI